MSLAKDIEIIEPQDDVIFPPGDLYSDEPPLESYLHLQQMILLLTCLEWWWRDGQSPPPKGYRQDFFAAGNLTVYYSPRQRKSEHFRGPDFFVVLGTERKPRKSWVVWEEGGQYPNIIIEILSSTTAATDRGLKKQIFQDIFRTPDYFWFDPDTLEFKGFHLLDGQYEELQPNAEGRLWSRQLGLYLGVDNTKLRFFTDQHQLIPTPAEAAEKEQVKAEMAQQEVERLKEQLRTFGAKLSLGVDPTDEVSSSI
jgi:Uma2 family endonuclease